MKWSAKEGKCCEMFSKIGKMIYYVQQRRENIMKCSAKERKCYLMFSKKKKCNEMFSKRGKML